MFSRNLNLFLPYWGLGSYAFGKLLGAVVLMPLYALALNNPNIYIFSSVAGYGIPLLLIAFTWWKFGLAPKAYKPTGERRAKIGHWIIAIANILALLVGALIFFLIYLMGIADNSLFLLLLSASIVLIAWIVGLVLIWSAYAPA